VLTWCPVLFLLRFSYIQGEHKVFIPDYKHLLQENYVEYKHIFYHY